MGVRFILTMINPVLKGKESQEITLDWTEEIPLGDALEKSSQWSSPIFLTERMEGLTCVGSSSLTIEPVEGF